MCQRSPQSRIASFADVEKTIGSNLFSEIDFSAGELEAYRSFADRLCRHISKLESSTKYNTDLDRIRTQLNDVYRRFMLELTAPDSADILRCFFNGKYYYVKQGFPVSTVKDFLKLIKSLPDEKFKVVLANLHTKLDAVNRYSDDEIEEVPF